MSEEKLQKELETLQQLSTKDSKIDVTGLMIKALDQHQSNLLPMKEKRLAYIVSLGLPPFGLFYALKYFASDKDDARLAAWLCVSLTAISAIGLVLLARIF